MSTRRLQWLPVASAILLSQTACSRDLEVLPEESCADHDSDAVVAFGDASLESAIRGALSFGPEQRLTCDLMTIVSTLDASGAGVGDLAGIQNLTELSFLVLAESSVTDLGPLGGLTALRSITLDGSTNLSDIQPLLDNAELGKHDLVYLRKTRASCGDVLALATKGVGVRSDCVGWWPGEGSAADAFGDNDGTITGDVSFAPGRLGQAFSFAGQGAYVRTLANVGVDGNQPRTVAAWVKGGAPEGARCCATPFSWGAAAGGGGFGSSVAEGVWSFWGYRDDTGTGVSVDTEWNHHVITYDASVMRYYLNGELVAEGRRALNTTASPLYIGTGFDLRPNRQFTGLVDELLVFNRAMDSADVRALYARY